ncbi:hypothetical protein MKK88_10985 [Methylobacterium sp. E-005]|uniref:hypothetical protein n=1 Tax=Methylobacterium sp. E-005 TaxID=2836549 RepID=UPI001FB9E118|nr:hypothetical protein [Methylobacterium sp. E-005]MCJ2086511.1 hypothetical protein [Methylobacterium sp. E-005]
MAALASLPAIEVTEGEVHKALTIHPIRYDTFAKLNLRFDRRYDRSIQLNRAQLTDFIGLCIAVRDNLREV